MAFHCTSVKHFANVKTMPLKERLHTMWYTRSRMQTKITDNNVKKFGFNEQWDPVCLVLLQISVWRVCVYKNSWKKESNISELFTLEWYLLLCASVCKQKHSYVRQWIVQEFMLYESFHTELLAITIALAHVAKNAYYIHFLAPLTLSLRAWCEWTLNINGLENAVCALFARRFRATR